MGAFSRDRSSEIIEQGTLRLKFDAKSLNQTSEQTKLGTQRLKLRLEQIKWEAKYKNFWTKHLSPYKHGYRSLRCRWKYWNLRGWN